MMMLNKNLLFLMCISVLLYATDTVAVEVLQPDDEGILWEVYTDDGKTLHGVVNQVVSGGGQEEIIYREPLKPFRGPGLMSIPVPEEINQKAYDYRDQYSAGGAEYIAVRSSTPRSMLYPIGREREEADSWRHQGFQPNFGYESAATVAHNKLIDEYKARAADCRNSRKEQLDMEMAMLYDKQLFRNAAYLSETFSDIMQCYDDLGLEIIDVFYYDDSEALRSYNQTTPQFEVKSTAPNFDTKYCEEGFCSMAAVAELQLEKFGDFEDYLKQLLSNAPVGIPFRSADSVVPEIDEAEVGAVVQPATTRQVNIVQRPVVRRVQTRRHQAVRSSNQPMESDDWDVPYIDEADL